MRVLVLGGNGQIGHRLWMHLRDRHETWVTLRGQLDVQPWARLFDGARVVRGITAERPDSFRLAMDAARPDLVLNAIGLVKQRPGGDDPSPAFVANTFVPHHVRSLCDAAGAKLIQISTDCVFSGARGDYKEDDDPDATDVYGLSKRLGEVAGSPHLTIRTSVIGRSLAGTSGLLEWFLAQRATIAGYRRATFSGITTHELARTLAEVIESHADLSGLWHIASPPIDKFSLLNQLAAAFHHDVTIEPHDEPVIDRSLDDSRFRKTTGIRRPTWEMMIDELAADPTPYGELRER